ncbi:MAG: putative acyltransferase [Ramlibacter sp.]|nr:putative acyltransferase [Ramlibacter sp.]
MSIVTWFRADEILAGASVALLYESRLLRRGIGAFSPWLLLPAGVFYLASAHPAAGVLAYLRPYAAATLIVCSLCTRPGSVLRVLRSRPLRHIALISYALYVWHPLLADSWLGAGEGLTKYYKRPLLFAALWALAYASTTHFEAFWISLGKRRGRRPARDLGTAIDSSVRPDAMEHRPRVQ